MRDCYKNDNNGRKELGDFKYCECALYKENIDTIQAVNLISKHLRHVYLKHSNYNKSFFY